MKNDYDYEDYEEDYEEMSDSTCVHKTWLRQQLFEIGRCELVAKP